MPDGESERRAEGAIGDFFAVNANPEGFELAEVFVELLSSDFPLAEKLQKNVCHFERPDVRNVNFSASCEGIGHSPGIRRI